MRHVDLDVQDLLALRAIKGRLVHLKWLTSVVRLELAMRRHLRALKYGYNPDQPRVPRGEPEGGRWTDDGGGGGRRPSSSVGSEEAQGRTDRRVVSDASPDPVRPGAQYAQNRGRSAGAGPVVINRVEVEPTPGQAARLAVVEAQARDALSRVRELDPKWKPAPSAYSTVEGYIASYQADARQARERLSDLQKAGIEPGPFVGESVPARGPERDFTAAERRDINRIGAESGCHTCGTMNPGTPRGNFVIDHQPPTAWNPTGRPQSLYPQCLTCSLRQGNWISRNGGRR